MSENFTALILAAGKGVRMKSTLPKVLHILMGKPMIHYVIDTVRQAGASDVFVVIGYGKALLEKALQDKHVHLVEQAQQLGTGHAVQCFAAQFPTPPENLLVVCGDTPLLSAESLKALQMEHSAKRPAVTMLTLDMAEPGNYGRILRDSQGRVCAIREAKDCTLEQKLIKEVNLAVYLFDGKSLFERLPHLKNQNRQNEYYLTDLIEMFYSDGKKIVSVKERDESSTLGINSRSDLAKVAGILKSQILEKHMIAGVTILDPVQTFIEPEVEIGAETVVYPGTTILGHTRIGEHAVIGPNTLISSSRLGDRSVAQFCIIENADLPIGSELKPFSTIKGSGVSPERKHEKHGDLK